MSKLHLIILTVVAVSLVDSTFDVSPSEWADYKAKFNKVYATSGVFSESIAKFYYSCNKNMIVVHNILYERNASTYKLAVNQFTDMPFTRFNALFQVAISRGASFDSPPPSVQPALPSYNPITDFGFTSNIEDQGTKCNSGWAYSAAKSIELFQAQQAGNKNPASLSAQNLIDCAGRATACERQVPQAAFDYLTQYKMGLHFGSDYKNNNTLSEMGMCTPSDQVVTKLAKYSRLKDGDDDSLKAYVSHGFRVVVEFNPASFQFMHYSEGIFQPPATLRGSHFMIVIGYGTNQSDYWLLQNSFGTTWGEKGLMRLSRTAINKVTRNAIFPIE